MPAQRFFCLRWVGPLFVLAPLVAFFEGCKHWSGDGILCALVIPPLILVVLREYNRQSGADVVGEHTRIEAALSNNCRIVHSAGLELIASWRALAAVLRTVGEASPGGRISDHHVDEVKALFSAYDHHCGRAEYEKVGHSGRLDFERVRAHGVLDGYGRRRAYVEAVDGIAQALWKLAHALEKFAPDDLLMRPDITSAHPYLAYTRAIGQAQSALDDHLKIALEPEDQCAIELSGDVAELQDSLTHLALQEEKLTREWLGLRQSVMIESGSRLEMVLPRYLSTYSTMGETLPARSVDITAAFYRATRRSGSMYEHARAVQAWYQKEPYT
ncbi:hypothetical protein GGG16DRAFT_118299 [Schizophyllum commune]